MADHPQAQEREAQEEPNYLAQVSQVDAEASDGASETTEAGENSAPGQEAVPVVEAVAIESEGDPASYEAGESEFAQMLAESGTDAKGEVKVGDKVSGVIAKIDGETAFVNYGGRGEAIIRTSELLDKDGKALFAVGDQIEAFAANVEDEVQLTRSVSRTDGNTDALYQAFKASMPVEAQVDAVNKWGMGVIFQGGVRGFCPISQIDTTYVESAEDYRGKTFGFKIIEFRHQGRDIVVSRRALLEAEQNKEAESVRATLKKGAKLKGAVTRLQDFGAFVALGAGVEGLVHVSEISHQRVNQPSDVLQEGQEIEVVVLDTKALGNRRKERISLSIKALEKNPWDVVREQFPAGTVATGKVDSMEDYGAFIELAEGVRGMVHVSEIADRRIAHPREVLSLGEEVRIVVLEADMRRQRLRLSIRQVESMESAANLRDFQDRMKREKVEEPTGNALTDALRRAKLVD